MQSNQQPLQEMVSHLKHLPLSLDSIGNSVADGFIVNINTGETLGVDISAKSSDWYERIVMVNTQLYLEQSFWLVDNKTDIGVEKWPADDRILRATSETLHINGNEYKLADVTLYIAADREEDRIRKAQVSSLDEEHF